MVNKVILLGRVGKKNDLQNANQTTKVLNFTMATNEHFKDSTGEKKEKTEWHRLVIFGPMAESFDKIVTVGSLVYVEGKLQTREWVKDGIKTFTTEVNVNTFQLASSNKKNLDDNSANSVNHSEQHASSTVDADLPF